MKQRSRRSVTQVGPCPQNALQHPVDLHGGLGAEHLDRRGLSRPKGVVTHRFHQLPRHQARGFKQCPTPGQIGLHPGEVDHA